MEQTPLRIKQAEADLRECIRRAAVWDSSCEAAAAHLAGAMAEFGIQRRQMVRRLRALGLSPRGAARLARGAWRSLRDRQKAEHERQFDGATPICPHCLGPLGPLDHFCPKCCGPVSAHASIDPLGRIYSTGRAYREAMSAKPRLVVLLGVWLIFGPSLVLFPLALYDQVRMVVHVRLVGLGDAVPSSDVLSGFLQSALLWCWMLLISGILWKMTARWIRFRRTGA